MLKSNFNHLHNDKPIVAARRAPRFSEMRDDCPDQCHAEGTLCGQRSSSRTLSTVSMRVKEEVSPAKESANLDVDNL